MPKPNTYVQLLNAQREIAELRRSIEIMKGFTLQQSLDIAEIANHRGFGFGPQRNRKFEQIFKDTFREFALGAVEDGKDDQELDYTKGNLDRALRAALGDDILPFEERYAPENLYFRDRAESYGKEKNNGCEKV